MFIDGISYGNKAEKSSVLLRPEVERLSGYFVDTVIEGKQDGIRLVHTRLQPVSDSGTIKRTASIVGCNQLSTLIEQSKKIASAHLPELNSAIFDSPLIVGRHQGLQTWQVC